SAVADLFVPVRAGTDIAFLGGIIRYVIENEKYFRDYLLAYSNAPTIITDKFRDTEDLEGVFSGLDEADRTYDFHTWMYETTEVQSAAGERDQQYEDLAGDSARKAASYQAGRGESHGSGGASVAEGTERDETLQHERCVFQIVKRHFGRYTPEMVEQI